MDFALSFAVFIGGSLILLALSWRSICNPSSHGMPRFLAWEGILGLLVLNGHLWFEDRYSLNQLISWLLLMLSIVVVFSGLYQLKTRGCPLAGSRCDNSLFAFEQTTVLVDTGIYAWIRHPMYLSLMLLAWGAAFKNITVITIALAVLVSFFLHLTSRQDERECQDYFGDSYHSYMQRSKRFLPFVW